MASSVFKLNLSTGFCQKQRWLAKFREGASPFLYLWAFSLTLPPVSCRGLLASALPSAQSGAPSTCGVHYCSAGDCHKIVNLLLFPTGLPPRHILSSHSTRESLGLDLRYLSLFSSCEWLTCLYFQGRLAAQMNSNTDADIQKSKQKVFMQQRKPGFCEVARTWRVYIQNS